MIPNTEKLSAKLGGANSITQYDCYIKIPKSGYYVFSAQHSGHIFIDGFHISDTAHIQWVSKVR